MTSRERARRALARLEVDRVPVDFGGTVVTSIDVRAYAGLMAEFGIAGGPGPIIDHAMGTVSPSEAIMAAYGSDFRRVSLNAFAPTVTGGEYTDAFGRVLRKADGHPYYDTVGFPLSGIEGGYAEAVGRMALPDPDDPAPYHGLRDRARDLYEGTEFSVVADFGVPGFYETAQKLRGYENLACDLLEDRVSVRALFDRLLDLQKRMFRRYLGQVGGYADVVGYADDLGMQDRPQVSPETYRDLIMPYHKEIFRYIHSLADIRILLHSCGAVGPLIPLFIEAGADVLNPVQTTAAGMDPKGLKAGFGDSVAFWGGVDVQGTLPFGDPESVAAEAEGLMRDMGPTGYVLAPSHNVQYGTPVGNLSAMFPYKAGDGRGRHGAG